MKLNIDPKHDGDLVKGESLCSSLCPWEPFGSSVNISHAQQLVPQGEFKHNWGTAEKLYKSEVWSEDSGWFCFFLGCDLLF